MQKSCKYKEGDIVKFDNVWHKHGYVYGKYVRKEREGDFAGNYLIQLIQDYIVDKNTILFEKGTKLLIRKGRIIKSSKSEYIMELL